MRFKALKEIIGDMPTIDFCDYLTSGTIFGFIKGIDSSDLN